MASFTGTADPDVLVGGIDNDTIEGLAGDDTLTGGGGDDVFVYATRGFGADIITDFSAGDRIDLSALHIASWDELIPFRNQSGNDFVLTFGYGGQAESITLRDFLVYNLTTSNIVFYTPAAPVTTDGTTQDDVIFSGGQGDHLYGHEGNDVLVSDSDYNILEGGAGNDTYYTSIFNTIVENPDEGIDQIITAWNIDLRQGYDNIENVTLLRDGILSPYGGSTAHGNDLGNILTGNTGDDFLYGEAGNDVLIGGDGIDNLVGGLGDDTYYLGGTWRLDDGEHGTYEMELYLDNASEVPDGGYDTAYTSYSRTLESPTSIERWILQEGAATVGNETTTHLYGNNNDNDLEGNSQDNALRGYAGVDNLYGMAGNDYLDGGLGADRLEGGAGDDTYYNIEATDTLVEEADSGTDTVLVKYSYTLQANFENITLLGAERINATGNDLDNILTGNIGNNILAGGKGNDTYYSGGGADTFVEYANEGIDTIVTLTSITLSANIENLIITGDGNSGTGNELDNVITADAGKNILTGLAGNDTLDGGAGADRMIGGTGNDIYYVNDASDLTIEAKDEGTDTVYASVTYLMRAQYIEDLYLTGTADINGNGNSLDNHIYGNSGINILYGGAGNDFLDGAVGADTLIGGQGNDVYYVDNFHDVMVEYKNEGTDTVFSSVQYIMGGSYVENATLTGTLNSYVVGNALDNILFGNMGTNNLTGGAGNDRIDGGVGADGMRGGVGNDIYYVDNLGDFIVENKDEGTDLVYSWVNFNLGAQYIENLSLRGNANINGLGNNLANTIIGNSGNNTLDGRAGNDTLTGGAGADIFLFTAGSGKDTVTDFSASQNDSLNLHAYNQATAVITQVGSNTVIDLGGGNIITLTGAAKADVISHIAW